ncbi:uncharacterized protein LOC129957050 [Argiope bruennichi]|uniref:Uncharacterized protein n=1 Tax=Argiope bruennichi TaxID=94029 RepID=A0A8T0FDS1_ARGBR|nr:uncharacterized protein LOC129957050 [Argiope bruennichi]XP_055925153.1 uncharacterized protein LOC129957050 [Argiope bruennichi]KAF8789266.1 hypothetical protein HNY73_007214 [Argiope bruennichi]
MSFPDNNNFSSELNVDDSYTGAVSTGLENMDKCKILEEDFCDAARIDALKEISKNTDICTDEKDMDSNSKVLNNNYCCEENCVKSDKDYFNEHSLKDVQNFVTLKNVFNLSPDFLLAPNESVLIADEFNSSSINSNDCSDLHFLEKMDCLLKSETTPFHPEIANFIQELLLEMEALLNSLKSGVNSVSDPVALSYITRCQTIRKYLEKILLLEFKKLEERKIEKQNFEEYTFCMKSSALKQDKLIHSLLEQVNSCVNENKSLHERLCFLKDKLQSFGLLKPEGNDEFKSYSEIVNQISDIDEIFEDNINLDNHHNNDIPNNYLEFLQIFKTSSANLQTLSIQARNLQLLSDSSHKLNDNLISRVQDQEFQMKGIAKQLEQAHNLLAAMKKQHQRLQSAENIVKYDLQEKRRFLNKLKQQLEATRENCDLVRMKNSKSEAEWQDLRREFVERNKQTSEESDFIDDRGEESCFIDDIGEENVLVDDNIENNGLIDQCITVESCVVVNNVNESVPNKEVSVSNSDTESRYELKRNRLQLLEEQCKLLYTNLKNKSNRGKELDTRLESWCKAIENSPIKASKKNNLSVILNANKEYKDDPDQVATENINIDFNSDVDSPLSSPEIESFDSDSCSCIQHDSSTISKELFSLESLKTDELLSSKINDLDSNKLSFEREEQQSVASDPLSVELYGNCDSKTVDCVQDSAYFESVDSLEKNEKCQLENCDSEEMLTQTKDNGHISSTEN